LEGAADRAPVERPTVNPRQADLFLKLGGWRGRPDARGLHLRVEATMPSASLVDAGAGLRQAPMGRLAPGG